jgi:hypothetical protein
MRAIKVGKCIYCHTTEGPLRREHLIAAGLSGIWTLQEATCGDCADITGAFEGHVLGPVLSRVRAGLNMKSRRGHPKMLPLQIDRGDGKYVSVDVPVIDYPALMQLPEFLPPAYFGREYKGGIDPCGVPTIQAAGPPAEMLARQIGIKRIQVTTTFEGHTFPRLLAKIAYTFLVADVGLDGIETAYVLRAILGRTNDIGQWVGCDETEYITDARWLHGVSMQVIKGEAIARVRLFINCNAPEYIVVVGRLTPDAKTGNFRPSGPLGEVRTRTITDVLANATRAPTPAMPENHPPSADPPGPSG